MESSPIQLGKKISNLRKRKGLSQKELAKFLDIPRSSLAQIELGRRNLSAFEFIELSKVLEFSMDQFPSTDYVQNEEILIVEESKGIFEHTRVSSPRLDIEKLKNVILYILEQCAGKPNLGETALNKLLYFSDFNYYEIYEEHLTGSEYKKLSYGPVNEKLNPAIDSMEAKELLTKIKTMYHGYPQTRYIPLSKANLKLLSAAEKEIIDQVILQFSNWSASAISEYSHQDMPWKATKNGEIIDYELCFYREPPFSVRIYNDETE